MFEYVPKLKIVTSSSSTSKTCGTEPSGQCYLLGSQWQNEKSFYDTHSGQNWWILDWLNIQIILSVHFININFPTHNKIIMV